MIPDAVRRETYALVSAIVKRPDFLAEVEAMLPALEAALRPLDPEWLKNYLPTQGIAFGLDTSAHPPEWWEAKWAPYHEALADIPACCVEHAFGMWHTPTISGLDPRECQFFPRPAQLHTLAARVKADLGLVRYRAKLAAERATHKPPPARARMSREEMIAAGYMDADGRVIGLGSAKSIPESAPRPTQTPQEVAAKLRATGVPINRSETQAPPAEAI